MHVQFQEIKLFFTSDMLFLKIEITLTKNINITSFHMYLTRTMYKFQNLNIVRKIHNENHHKQHLTFKHIPKYVRKPLMLRKSYKNNIFKAQIL